MKVETLGLKTRGVALVGVGLVEVLALYLFYGMRTYGAGVARDARPAVPWLNANLLVKDAFYLLLFSTIALAIVSWPRRNELYASWTKAASSQPLLWPLALNALIFVLLLLATTAFKASGAEVPLAPFLGWCIGVVVMLLALVRAAAPLIWWVGALNALRMELLISIISAALVSAIAALSQGSWSALSGATLELSRWMLERYETGVEIDTAQRVLGVAGFKVVITAECSGYEGVGLVLGFLGVYVAMFKNQLRFPHALLLFPIGGLAIWVANSARIAALISLGAHWSPDIASHGFHSQAGWIMFLMVAIGVMVVGHGTAFFRKSGIRPAKTRDPALQTAIAFLLPLIAVMTARILTQTFSAASHWLYAVELAAGGGALWLCRDVYVRLIAKVSVGAIVAGLGVGVGWIATDPGQAQSSDLAAWLATLSPAVLVGWLALRVVGSVVLAPISEELAFRGYLHRALISRRFESVALSQFTWIAFLTTSILFGLMHSRWLSATLAGVVYAIVMYRTNRLSDPIAAHMASNAVIAGWAIIFNQYSLL